MFHHYLFPDADMDASHYAVSITSPEVGRVIVQLGEQFGNQARVLLTSVQAQHMADLLEEAARRVVRGE
jgi:PHP family Zn ribbon phosphoesterase